MILKSFLFDNLVSLCTKIINSVIVVGLYYGFLTAFSISPSYFFFLQAKEESTENKVSATTGFFMGQLIMLISIYYTPLHLTLGRPHTITILILPYLLLNYCRNNQEFYFIESPRFSISMRYFDTQYVFLNNLVFQLFNYFLIPNSMVFRLVNIYMFQCNKKFLFVTSSFVGWLIGQILFIKWLERIVVRIRRFIRFTRSTRFTKPIALIQSRLIRSPLIQSTKSFVPEIEYLISDFFYSVEEFWDFLVDILNSMSRICSIFLVVIFIYYLGAMPMPLLNSNLKQIAERNEKSEKEMDEEEEMEEEIDVKMERTYETKEEKEKKNLLCFGVNESYLVTLLFDYKQWRRPLRYIKNDRFENAVKNEMSQYFFSTCQNDGKERISFTCPPSLSTFWEMIQRKKSLSLCTIYTTEKFFCEELNNYWIYTNEEKKNILNNEFRKRIEALDTKYLYRDVLEKKNRLCNDKRQQEYLPKKYDPLLNGPYRGTKKEFFLPEMLNEIAVKDSIAIENFLINKIYSIIFNHYNCYKFEQKKNPFYKKSLSTEISHFLILISEFAGESISNLKGIFLFPEQGRISSKSREKTFHFLFDTVITDSTIQTTRENSIEINEINKNVPRWSHKLLNEFEQQAKRDDESITMDYQIRSRKWKKLMSFREIEQKINFNSPPSDIDSKKTEGSDLFLRGYLKRPDFRREIIKGSMRAQRRKTGITKVVQSKLHSPFFLDRLDRNNYDIFGKIKRILGNIKQEKFEIQEPYIDREKQEIEIKMEQRSRNRDEKYQKQEIDNESQMALMQDVWEMIPLAPAMRSFLLVLQSSIRRNITLPFLITVKYLVRSSLGLDSERDGDMKELEHEKYLVCTYDGTEIVDKESPQYLRGIQIKVINPFRLKFCREEYDWENDTDSCFLTALGLETDRPYGHPQIGNLNLFLEPLLEELVKKIQKFQEKFAKKLRKGFFIALKIFKRITISFLKVFKKRTISFLKVLEETSINVQKIFIKTINKYLSLFNINPILVYRLKEDSSEIKKEKEKDSRMKNRIIHESSIQTQSMDWNIFSLTEKKMKNLTNRTSIIKKEIERITKDKENLFRTLNINPNKPSYGTKRIESICQILKILKRGMGRLIRKSPYFLKIFWEMIWERIWEEIYRKIFLYINIVNSLRLAIQPVLESKKKMKFFSTNKKKISKKNSNISFSFLSQAHVFYKLSQTQVLNLYKLRSVLEYHGISLFLKNEIKDSLRTQGIIYSQLKHKKLHNSEINQWKIWLKSNYQYNLSPIEWSKLVPKKWRKRVNQHCKVKNSNLSKRDLYKETKTRMHSLQKKNDSEIHENKKFKKIYRYDLLSYKFLYYEDNKDSYSYESPFQLKKNQSKNSTYNYYNTHKEKKVAMWGPITNYRGKKDIIDIDKNPDRKFFDWKIINFFLRKKVNIGAWIDISTNSSKNAKTDINNYQNQIFDKMDEEDLFYFPIHQEINSSNQKKNLFDWMGMNEEIFNRPISKSKFRPFFFPEFWLFSNVYKNKPWIIPIRSLFFNLNVSKTLSKNKNTNSEKKKDSFILPNENKSFEFEFENLHQDQEGLQTIDRWDHIVYFKNKKSTPSEEQKSIQKDFVRSEMKKTKERIKGASDLEIRGILKRYFVYQLSWYNMDNLETLAWEIHRMLKLINLDKLSMRTLPEVKMTELKFFRNFSTYKDFMKLGILILEEIHSPIKNNGQFIMYKTIGIPLVHKSKDKKKIRSYENLDKKNFDESIAKHQKMTKNRDKNHYDLFSPETILSPRRRRELRILICFNSKRSNGVDKNEVFWNRNKVKIKNCGQFFDESKDLDKDKTKLIKLKLFLWPNFRLEDLACMNRYWFNTTNSSRFSMLRIHMYPRLIENEN
uniref:hypothetical protein RF1 n=1 Tax=Habropetalum dawei TaxID=122300 RepID=UPI002A814CAD|nr:hypothetical protein RF1 [Habropetalum dawei]UZP15902.1 hypothetical protein RF1 [Habropetalum dawei]